MPLPKSVPWCVNPSQLHPTNQLAINLVNSLPGQVGFALPARFSIVTSNRPAK